MKIFPFTIVHIKLSELNLVDSEKSDIHIFHYLRFVLPVVNNEPF